MIHMVKTICYVVPVKQYRHITITRPPESYLSHLIGHEGEGSLLTLLKRRGLASELVVGEKNNASGTGLSQ
ncbi:unnamed protein product [Didymodactylos carnosus]|uniref:Uncharacterized protein n=1 Tax=Didymodactylos carnosus TaxID=1234261 RepID=A0A8S2DPJ4_9BILA|nr:unnamed protein product [Didymodactylos carnosus]CAF3749314.1 unnamed protein product [Didymodactylos carnosus]